MPDAGRGARDAAREDFDAAGYRALVCVTTCHRLPMLRRCLPHLAAACASDSRFHLVVSLDGDDPAYRAFCRAWSVPLVWADAREGAGLARNRVLERWPDYDYYVFLDDDVELVDGSLLADHVALVRASGIHHLSLFEAGGVRGVTGERDVGGVRVVHGLYGGGQFNVYSAEALARVGGWHPRFAEYRRWGHTEHSWRVHRAGLAPAPFNVVEAWADRCIWHYPPPVSAVDALPRDADQLVAPERELIEEGVVHVPLRTLAPHHHEGPPPGCPETLARAVAGGDRYPLIHGRERRHARSDHALWQAGRRRGARRLGALARAAAWWPGNPLLRHRLKRMLGR